MARLISFLRRHIMPSVAVVAALLTCALVPPDAGYAGYVDWGTLAKLASMLLAVGGLNASGIIQVLASRVVATCSDVRLLVFALVGMTALASMFVTNDMALLALLPLAAACLVTCGRLDLVAPVFVLQGLAANLCGMLLPFGNPQNIYLAGFFGIGFADFVCTMLPPFALATVLVGLACPFVGKGVVRVKVPAPAASRRQAALSTGALACCVAAVVDVLPSWVCLACVVALTLAGDTRLPLRIDWGLIVTFAAFSSSRETLPVCLRCGRRSRRGLRPVPSSRRRCFPSSSAMFLLPLCFRASRVIGRAFSPALTWAGRAHP